MSVPIVLALSVDATSAAASWVPTQAPVPAILPSGQSPMTTTLLSTACSSSTSCVAVGSVSDSASNLFPLIETYSSGSWSASVAPLPPDAAQNPWSGDLTSVSCPADGACVAVGNYYAYDSGSAQSNKNGLLLTETAGTWSAAEASLPGGPDSGSASVNSVSCPDNSMCAAIGVVTTFAKRVTTSGLLYTWSGGIWQSQVVSLPSPFQDSLDLASISCPDDTDCTAVGSYVVARRMHGLIATMSSGVWNAVEAPEPSNAATAPFSPPQPLLESVDCPEVTFCVAGGAYPLARSGGPGNEAQLLVYQFGSWLALEAPLPSDADSATLPSSVQGVFCPAVNDCLAAGTYNESSGGSSEGMLLAQAGSAWSAASSPTLGDSSPTSVSGISCSPTGFCAAVGADGPAGLIETETVAPFPSVTAISPPSGPTTGGTSVTITGNNFSPGTSAAFGAIAASTTFDNAGELTAVAPSTSLVGPVDVTVSSGGVASRSDVTFSYGPPSSAASTVTVLASSNNPSSTGQSTTYTAQVSPAPDGGAISFLSNDVPIATCLDLPVHSGQAQCSQTYQSAPGDGSGPGSLDISAQYSGDLNDGASSATLTQGIDVGTLSIDTTQLPKGHENRAYTVSLGASGGNAPYSWTVASGSQLPPGLTLDEAGGILSGRPTKAMTFVFTVQVTDSTTPTPSSTTEMLSLRITR
ncbi:MAG TPA: IPT/TIG domain-containing protein [Acidimicrobiales bacterium]